MSTGAEMESLFSDLAPDVSWTWQEYDPNQWPELVSWLSSREQASLETYGSEKRRREFVLGRAAARRLAGERLGVSPANVDLRVAGDGAVDVVGTPFHLSISHANGWATAALSPRAVGIDMERLVVRTPGVYRYFLSRDEYDLLEGTDLDHDRLQILLWTLKESVLKGTRTGLRVSPRDIRILSLDFGGSATVRDLDDAIWRIEWVFWRDCYLAIADRENQP